MLNRNLQLRSSILHFLLSLEGQHREIIITISSNNLQLQSHHQHYTHQHQFHQHLLTLPHFLSASEDNREDKEDKVEDTEDN